MAKSKTLLVTIDYSRGSEKAFDYALRSARETKAKLVALNVVPAELIYPPTGGQFDFYGLMSGMPAIALPSWRSVKASRQESASSYWRAVPTSPR